MSNLTNENFSPKIPMPNNLKSKLNSAQSKISDQASQVAEKASSYLEDTRHYVKENPVKSLALAAATGLAAGGLISVILQRRK